MNTMTAPAPAPAASALAENARHALIDVALSDVENAARDTNVYTFRRPDGGKLPPYRPGAHIDIHLPNGLIRQFSLLNPSADPDSYVVAIKHDAASRGGSRYIFGKKVPPCSQWKAVVKLDVFCGGGYAFSRRNLIRG